MSVVCFVSLRARWRLGVLISCLVGALGCGHQAVQSAPLRGTVYAKQMQAVGYAAIDGTIVELTCDYIRINATDGKRLLLTRDLVQRVELGDHKPETYKDWDRSIRDCWNKEKSPFLAVLQKIPYLGSLIEGLDALRPGIATFFAIVLLLGGLVYGAYRVYELSVTAIRVNVLSRTKLDMEVRKLRYEIETLRRELGVPSEPVAERSMIEQVVAHDVRVTQPRIRSFIKHTVLRIPVRNQIRRRLLYWQKYWNARRTATGRLPEFVYYGQMTVNWLITIAVGLFCFGCGIDVFLVPFLFELEGTGLARFAGAAVFFLLFVLSLAACLRLTTTRRIMRKTYLKARRLPM